MVRPVTKTENVSLRRYATNLEYFRSIFRRIVRNGLRFYRSSGVPSLASVLGDMT